jgi:hypothetical protein
MSTKVFFGQENHERKEGLTTESAEVTEKINKELAEESGDNGDR